MPFKPGPIKPDPTCPMCGKSIKAHTEKETRDCMEKRKQAEKQKRDLKSDK